MSMFLMLILSAFMKAGAPQPYLLEVHLSDTNPDAIIQISDDGTLKGFDSCHQITGLASVSGKNYTPLNVKISDKEEQPCDNNLVALASNITAPNVNYEVTKTQVGVTISTYPGLSWNLMGSTRMGED